MDSNNLEEFVADNLNQLSNKLRYTVLDDNAYAIHTDYQDIYVAKGKINNICIFTYVNKAGVEWCMENQ